MDSTRLDYQRLYIRGDRDTSKCGQPGFIEVRTQCLNLTYWCIVEALSVVYRITRWEGNFGYEINFAESTQTYTF